MKAEHTAELACKAQKVLQATVGQPQPLPQQEQGKQERWRVG